MFLIQVIAQAISQAAKTTKPIKPLYVAGRAFAPLETTMELGLTM